MTNHIGSTLESLFEETGELEEVRARAIKRALVYAAARQMEEKGINKKRLATLLETSRSQVDRILDEDDTSITLGTIVRLAAVLEIEASLDFDSVGTVDPYSHALAEKAREPNDFTVGSYAETFSAGVYVIANEAFAA